jgi:hypothetical protein
MKAEVHGWRMLEVISGLMVFLLWVSFWFRVFFIGWSHGNKLDIPTVVIFLMFVAPGMLVAMGCYLQAVHCKRWAFGVALIGMLGMLVVIGVTAPIVYAYIGDPFGLRLIYSNLSALGITFIAICVQTLRDNPVRGT